MARTTIKTIAAATACLLGLGLGDAQAQSRPAEPATHLGAPVETHCRGQDALLASYYGLFDNIWLARRLDKLDRYVDPDFSIPNAPPAMPKGQAIISGFVTMVKTAFPKRYLINDLILCGDNIVVARQTVMAINDGPFMGKPPSGVTTTVTWTDSYRFRDGRLLQTFGADGDSLGTSRQIGWVLTPPGDAAPATTPIPWVDIYPTDPENRPATPGK